MRDSPVVITLPEECGLAWAIEAHETFMSLMASAGSPGIDVSAVRRMTTPAVQLVLALAHEAFGQGRRLVIAGHSPAFDHAVTGLALESHFEQWSERFHG